MNYRLNRYSIDDNLKVIKEETKGNTTYIWLEKEADKTKKCKHCSSDMHIISKHKTKLKDKPDSPGEEKIIIVYYSKFKCSKCNHIENDAIPLKEPNMPITKNLAYWIKMFLSQPIPLPKESIAELFSVDISVVEKIEKKINKTK